MLMFLKNIKNQLSKYIDVNYFGRFILILLSIYYFNIFYISVIDKNGLIYSSFLDQHLNYINWLRNSILHTSKGLTHLMGLESYIFPPYHLKTVHGTFVEMVYECLGFGLMSFWIAFVMANTQPLKTKAFWCIIGLICLWFINCWRVALLLLAYEYHWKIVGVIDHHTLFNLFAYSLMLVLIRLYIIKQKNNSPVTTQLANN